MTEPVRTGNELVLYRLDQLEDKLDKHFAAFEKRTETARERADDLALRVDRLEQSRRTMTRVVGVLATGLTGAGAKMIADLVGALGG